METQTIKSIRDLINYWWLILLAGVLLIVLGIWVFSSPVLSYLSLSMAFAIGMLATGVFEIVFSLTNYKSLDGWGWTLAGGIVDLFMGGYLLSYPGITMVILPLIVGFWMLFSGIMAIGRSFDIRSYGILDWGWLLFGGIVIVLLAMFILANPAFGMANIVIWTGAAFILSGIFRIYFSLKLRRLKP